jgi:hypothetical protein
MSNEYADAAAPWFDPSHPMNARPHRRPTIDELERILQSEEDTAIEILPNGEIRELGSSEKTDRKPLTMRENLGGEYAGVMR